MPEHTLSLQSRLWRWLWSRVVALTPTFAASGNVRAAQKRWLDHAFLPPGVTRQSVLAGDVPAEWIVPAADAANGVLLYLHGGAWTIGWNQAHRWLVGYLVKATGRRALAVDYRVAPEYPFPAALEDCRTAYHWLLNSGILPEQVIIAGDSAGGNLALSTMLSLRDGGEQLPAAAVLLSPATDLAGMSEQGAVQTDVGLPLAWAKEQLRLYLGDSDPRQPLVSPYYADLTGLPALLIQVGGDENLLDDVQRFAPRARAAGVDVTLQVWPGMWHVWQILVPLLAESRQALGAIASFCRQHTGRASTHDLLQP